MAYGYINTIQLMVANSALSGSGNLVAPSASQLLALTIDPAVGIAGAGALTASIIDVPGTTAWQGAANFGGAGALVAPGTLRLAAALPGFAGVGALATPNLLKLIRPTAFPGAGKLTANATQVINYSTFDPVNSYYQAVLSNGNLTLGSGGSTQLAMPSRGTKSQNSGKKYFEMTLNQTSIDALMSGVGVCNASFGATSSSCIGGDAGGNSWGLAINYQSALINQWDPYYAGTASSAYTGVDAPANGVLVGVAVDFTIASGAKPSVYFMVDNVWAAAYAATSVASFNSAYPDFQLASAQALWPCASVDTDYSGGTFSSWTFNPGSSAFRFTPPAGFSAWT